MEKETEEKPLEQIETTKNKWLYPTDNFGRLEKNIVFESKTYQSGINETQTENFKIITVRKTKKIKKK